MNNKYTPINSVLYDLSLTIDDRYWNESKMLQWLIHGVRQINIESLLVDNVTAVEVTAHKAQLPADFVYLTQVAYSTADVLGGCSSDIGLDGPENFVSAIFDSDCSSNITWKPMKLTTNPYHKSICLDDKIINCSSCEHQFSISSSLIITTTLPSGTILVGYKGYPLDEENQILIPDDETLKEALLHYVLYRYWLSKFQMKEEGADSRMKFHLTMWATLSKKAMNLNLPDISQLENIKAIHNRLAPRSNRFQQLFLTLNERENDSY